MYCEADLVRIAKRENNKKRAYVVANRLQGKHIPVSPDQALFMFEALADIVQKSYCRKNPVVQENCSSYFLLHKEYENKPLHTL